MEILLGLLLLAIPFVLPIASWVRVTRLRDELASASQLLRDQDEQLRILTKKPIVATEADNQIDQTAPVVNSISRLVPLTEFTTAGSVTFRVIFSEPVSGVDPSDFTITTSGTLSAVSWTVSGGVQAYDVTVSGLTGSGVLRLDLRSANTGIADAVGNLCVAGYQSGETYSIGPADATPPAAVRFETTFP